METASTLVCQFKDDLGKTRTLNIDYPMSDPKPELVKTFMESAIAHNILIVDKDNLDHHLVSIHGAYVSHKTVEPITL